MGSREDNDYWNAKQDEPRFCEVHEDQELDYDTHSGEYWCSECDFDDAIERIYRYG